MAKRTYKILRFDGGINNDADPRDIGDNQFADLQNVAVDEMGKIIVLGDCSDSKTSFKDITGDLSVNGRGLFAFSTDYNGVVGDSSGTKTYYLIEKTGVGIEAEQAGTTTSSEPISANVVTPTYYSADGILRVGDANHAAPIAPRWKGYIKRFQLGGNDSADNVQWGHSFNIAADGWSEKAAAISGCFPETLIAGSHADDVGATTVGTNLIMGDGESATPTSAGRATLFAFGNETCDTGTGPTYTGSSTTSGMYWGHACNVHSVENGTGTWQPDDNASYQFYATTMYDLHTQESLPQLFSMYPDEAIDGSPDVDYEGDAVVTGYKFPGSPNPEPSKP